MNIKLHRIYEKKSPSGYRVLVDRLWPRGISKEDANLDDYWKELAPSNKLRKWFDHDPDKWGEFRQKYLHELKGHQKEVKECLDKVTKKNLILLYGAKDVEHNQALVLKEYLEILL